VVPQWVWRIGCGRDEVVANTIRRLVTVDYKSSQSCGQWTPETVADTFVSARTSSYPHEVGW